MSADSANVLAIIGNAAAELECYEKGVQPRTCDGQRGHGWVTAAELTDARAAIAELIGAASEMNRLAKGPAGGVSQSDKRAVIARMEAAIANIGGAK